MKQRVAAFEHQVHGGEKQVEVRRFANFVINGGAHIIVNNVSKKTIPMSKILGNVFEGNQELCGYIHDAHHILTDVGPVFTDRRGTCKNTEAPFVWHTHPKGTKFYPSIDDLKLVLSYDSQRENIYTPFGTWKLRCPANYGDIYEIENVWAEYDEVARTLYMNTDHGHEYNQEAVQEYVQHTNQVFAQHNKPLFQIGWAMYSAKTYEKYSA
jgi:hypothetical protein